MRYARDYSTVLPDYVQRGHLIEKLIDRALKAYAPRNGMYLGGGYLALDPGAQALRLGRYEGLDLPGLRPRHTLREVLIPASDARGRRAGRHVNLPVRTISRHAINDLGFLEIHGGGFPTLRVRALSGKRHASADWTPSLAEREPLTVGGRPPAVYRSIEVNVQAERPVKSDELLPVEPVPAPRPQVLDASVTGRDQLLGRLRADAPYSVERP